MWPGVPPQQRSRSGDYFAVHDALDGSDEDTSAPYQLPDIAGGQSQPHSSPFHGFAPDYDRTCLEGARTTLEMLVTLTEKVSHWSKSLDWSSLATHLL